MENNLSLVQPMGLGATTYDRGFTDWSDHQFLRSDSFPCSERKFSTFSSTPDPNHYAALTWWFWNEFLTVMIRIATSNPLWVQFWQLMSKSCNKNTFSKGRYGHCLWRPDLRFTSFIYQRMLVTNYQHHTGSSNLYSTYLSSWILLKVSFM